MSDKSAQLTTIGGRNVLKHKDTIVIQLPEFENYPSSLAFFAILLRPIYEVKKFV